MKSLECILTNNEVKNLCKVLWHARGMMGDLLAPHPGFAFLMCQDESQVNELLLEVCRRASQNVLATSTTLNVVHIMKMHQEWEEGHKDVDPQVLGQRTGL